MPYSHPPKDIVRFALYDAIDWTTSLIDAQANADGLDNEPHERLLADYRLMLRRRYGEGGTPHERLGIEGRPVALGELARASPRPFKGPRIK